MRIKTLTICAALAIAAAAAAYGAESDVSGNITLGGRLVAGENQSAKFREYRDLDDGIFGSFLLNTYKDGYFLSLKGENVGLTDEHVGLDDQSYKLKGGKFGSFKYSLFYDETPHNLSFHNRTFFTGVGTNNLTGVFNANPDTWASRFDYTIQRRDYGGGIELSLNTPFYFSAKFVEQDAKGLKPLGATTAATGGPFYEMPEPVDYKTNNLFFDTGYRSTNLVASLDGMLSTFRNKNDYLTWQDPTPPNGVNSLPPDNDYWKVGGQAAIKLPLSSTLALRGSFAKLESEPNLLTTDKYKGDVTYTSTSAALTSNPIKPLDTKIFLSYLRKDNASNTFTFGGAETEVFHYKKLNGGLDIGYRLPLDTRANTGYEYLKVDRNRQDATTTEDHIVYAQLKNDYFDMVTAKVRYQYLNRGAEFDKGTVGTGTNTATLGRFERRFDATDKTQHAVKAGVDLTPMEHLEFGIEYAYKVDDYDVDRTKLGRALVKRHEVLFDAAYELPGVFKVSGYFDYEKMKDESNHRYFQSGGVGANPDPGSGVNVATSYNWTATLNDENIGYGAAVEVPIIKDRLDFIASWDYAEADGAVEFVTFGPSLQDIPAYDDYVKKTLNAKAVYKMTRALTLTAGYLYENYEYIDQELQNYQFVLGTNAFSGAYADHDYEAHVGYLMATYRF
ncbi:MAG: MtrB/PioB family outer membrane beta-barrel protein [Geobacter sp.]|nr:MtrB/PioB family outer membrane beta-barrel protein [Geobacter sp.]